MKDALDQLLAEIDGDWKPVSTYWYINALGCNYAVDEATKNFILREWFEHKGDKDHQIPFTDIYGGPCVTCPGALYGVWLTTPELRAHARAIDKLLKSEEPYEDK